MREDEEATIRTLTTCREIMAKLIQRFRGRVVDAPGDNLLAEFASVVDAANCAVEIQCELAEQNATLPEERRMEFRIGVNLGDVVEEEGRIYGDSVNIAARVESICEGGGVCISGTAYEHVQHKLDLEFEDLGDHDVKNIPTTVRVYRVLSYPGAATDRVIRAEKDAGRIWRNRFLALAAILLVGSAVGIWQLYKQRPLIESASVKNMAHPLPDKPSIAVLPFAIMSDDPKQEYFCDGVTEDLNSNKLNREMLEPVILTIASYALVGRDKDARRKVDWFSTWTYSFPLQFLMRYIPFKNPKIIDRLAEGLVNSGLAVEESSVYYKIADENRLTGQEIKGLLFGRKIIGLERWVERSHEGRALYHGFITGSDKVKAGMRTICYATNGKSAMAAIKYAILFFATLKATLRIKTNIYILLIYRFFHFHQSINQPNGNSGIPLCIGYIYK